jgi:hypothetical protein
MNNHIKKIIQHYYTAIYTCFQQKYHKPEIGGNTPLFT